MVGCLTRDLKHCRTSYFLSIALNLYYIIIKILSRLSLLILFIDNYHYTLSVSQLFSQSVLQSVSQSVSQLIIQVISLNSVRRSILSSMHNLSTKVNLKTYLSMAMTISVQMDACAVNGLQI